MLIWQKAIVCSCIVVGATLGVYVANRPSVKVSMDDLQLANVAACVGFGCAVGAMLGMILTAVVTELVIWAASP